MDLGNNSRIEKYKTILNANEKNLLLKVYIQSGNLKLVHFFIQAGASVDARYEQRKTPLILAASANFVSVVYALVKAGADMSATSDNNETALSSAIEKKHIETAYVLISLMSPEQLNIEINCHSEIQTHLDNYQKTRNDFINIIKIFTLVFSDSNPKNPFASLPWELKNIILLKHCIVKEEPFFSNTISSLIFPQDKGIEALSIQGPGYFPALNGRMEKLADNKNIANTITSTRKLNY